MKLDILIVLFAELNYIMKNNDQWLWLLSLKCAMYPETCSRVGAYSASARFEVAVSKKGAKKTSKIVKAKWKCFSSSRLSPEELLC